MLRLRANFISFLWLSLFGLSLNLLHAQQVPEAMKIVELDAEQEKRFYEIAGELRCPTCTGLSVLDSQATFSTQIQNILREQVSEGRSKSEILSFFKDRYGAWILREPPKEGANLFYWILPFALLAGLGLGLVGFLVRSESANSSQNSVLFSFDEKAATLLFLDEVGEKNLASKLPVKEVT